MSKVWVGLHALCIIHTCCDALLLSHFTWLPHLVAPNLLMPLVSFVFLNRTSIWTFNNISYCVSEQISPMPLFMCHLTHFRELLHKYHVCVFFLLLYEISSISFYINSFWFDVVMVYICWPSWCFCGNPHLPA